MPRHINLASGRLFEQPVKAGALLSTLGEQRLRHLLLASFRWTDNVETIAGMRLQRRADREPIEGDLLVYRVGGAVSQEDARPTRDRVAGGSARIRRRRGNGADRRLL